MKRGRQNEVRGGESVRGCSCEKEETVWK